MANKRSGACNDSWLQKQNVQRAADRQAKGVRQRAARDGLGNLRARKAFIERRSRARALRKVWRQRRAGQTERRRLVGKGPMPAWLRKGGCAASSCRASAASVVNCAEDQIAPSSLEVQCSPAPFASAVVPSPGPPDSPDSPWEPMDSPMMAVINDCVARDQASSKICIERMRFRCIARAVGVSL